MTPSRFDPRPPLTCSRFTPLLLMGLLLAGATTVRAGDLLVASGNSHQVLRYDSVTGAFQSVLVTAGSGGLANPRSHTVGPDGNLYVASFATDQVLRYDLGTGSFIDVFVTAGSGGLDGPSEVWFGPDGDLYVASQIGGEILQYDGLSGAFLGELVADDPATVGIDERGGLVAPERTVVGPDGHLYVAAGGADAVIRYDRQTGAFRDVFVTAGSGGLDDPRGLGFGPDGHFYVASFGTHQVLRYDRTSGAFLGVFVTSGSGGLSGPHDLVFGTDFNLYVASFGSDEVLRYDGATGASLGAFVIASSGGLDGPTSLAFVPGVRLDLFAPMPGTPGGTSTITVRQATPGQTVFFLLAFVPARLKVPSCVSLFADLALPMILGTAVADSGGVAVLSSPVPGLAADQTVLFQAVELSSCRVSDVVRYTFPDTGTAANLSIQTGGTLKNSSTYTSNSFRVRNDSQSGKRISRFEIDLASAILPDTVYDPFGQAGDTVGKNFTVDTDPGVGITSNGFLSAHDLGWDILFVELNNFDPGEELRFSVDVDPTTIQGSSAPGPNESGSVSGLELIGAKIKVVFSDGSVKVSETFRTAGSSTGSEIGVIASQAAAPSIEVLGLPAPSQTTNPNQTVRIKGPIGATVRLVNVEAGLFTSGLPGGGHDVDPFEANSAVAVAETTATIGTSGSVDIPITLTRADSNSGYNHLRAVVLDGSGRPSRVSSVRLVQLIP